MVLKYLTINKKTGRGEWNYLDNIAFARTSLGENDERVISFRVDGYEMTTIPIEDVAYLMNDNGKTIEVL